MDTGGFEAEEADPLAGRVASQVKAAVEQSDLVLLVTDGLAGPHPGDKELARMLRRSGRPLAVLVNKIDGPSKAEAAHEFHSLGLSPVLAVSAAHGYGLDALRDLISESLSPDEAESSDSPTRVAVIGRPNAGKSSLVNRLCGEDRMVVHERPGTTRDAIDVDIEKDGRRYTLVDTAGVRRRGRVDQKLEKLSVMRAIKGIEGSDVAVLVIDALEGLADQDAHIAGYAHDRGRPLVILVNKWDAVEERLEARKELKRQFDLKMVFLEKAPVLTVSALTGSGLKKLLPLIDSIMEQYVFRAKTHEVNEVLEKAMAAHVPPQAGRTRLKFYYATQASSKPPTFVAFANKPDAVHFSYKRFLVNQLKKAFRLDLVPVKLHIRGRHDEESRPAKAASKLGAKSPAKPKAASTASAKQSPKKKQRPKKKLSPKTRRSPELGEKDGAKTGAKSGAKAAAKPSLKTKPAPKTNPGPETKTGGGTSDQTRKQPEPSQRLPKREPRW